MAPSIVKYGVRCKPVSSAERLTVTLKYLATGDSQASIAIAYRMSPTTVGRIVNETCKIIWDVLLTKGYRATPSTTEQWKCIGQKFENKWNFRHCLGAIDGKHVIIQEPSNNGSIFNYKKTFLIVLLAVCDAQYQFTMVDIGESGRNGDAGIFSNCSLGDIMR